MKNAVLFSWKCNHTENDKTCIESVLKRLAICDVDVALTNLDRVK